MWNHQTPKPRASGLDSRSFGINRKNKVVRTAIAFIAFVSFSLFLIDCWRSWNTRELQVAEAQTATRNMARAIAQHADDTIKAADVAILGIEQQLLREGWSEPALKRLRDSLVLRVNEVPQINGLFVLDKAGNRVVHSLPFTPTPANNSDRAYFQYHLNHSGSAAHVGTPIRSKSTGEWVFTISRRLNDDQGQFIGVVLATISLEYFNRFYQRFELGTKGAIVLGHNAAVMLTRRPVQTDSAGKDMRATTVFRESQRYTRGNFTVKSAQDGIVRINSFERLENYPLFVAAALSYDEVLQTWRSDSLMHLSVTVILVSLFIVFGFYLVAQIRLRLHAEMRSERDRVALLELNQTLQRLSMQDGLTELANRRCFDEYLEKELQRARREQQALALLMIDLDYFKRYNDRYGHLAGDDCLRRVAQAIKQNLKRPADLAARYGGEEMAVILPATDIQGAEQIAQQIRQAIVDLQIEHLDNSLGLVSVSVGVHAVKPDLTTTAEQLIKQTDQALYSAKNLGRNRCVSTRAENAAL